MAGFRVTVEGRNYKVDAPDPDTAWDWANQFHGEAKTKRETGVRQMQEAERARFKAEEAKNPMAPWANLGAGFDTAWQGAKQLGAKVGIGPGVSDEELRESRRMKGELAETTPGGSLLQLAGEVAPTAVLPMGALGATGGLTRALALGGTSAAGGAAAGALQPVLEDESRLANTAFGAAGGAAAPVVVRGAAKMLPRALGGRGEGEVATRAGSRLVKALGGSDEALEAAGKLEAPQRSRLTRSIPLTAAEKARSPELARVELAARRDAPEQFAELARRQNEAIHRAALRAGKEGTEETVSRAATARDVATAPMREEALGLASKFSHVSEPLQNNTAEILQRTAKGSAANRVASHVQGVLETNPNPAQLYDLRKDLVRRVTATDFGDELSAAVKGADRETMVLVHAIDERLNEAASRTSNTGDLWTRYLDEYTGMSPAVTSAKAQKQINQALTAEGRPLVGNAPETTRHVLKQAVDKFGKNKFGTRLTPEAQGRYSELTDFLAKKEEPMRSMKLGGTGGGGSQTAMQTAARTAINSKIPIVGGALVDAVVDKFTGATRAEVAEMMLDPARAAKGIRAALQAGRPLSANEQAFLALSRSAGAGAGAALTGTE